MKYLIYILLFTATASFGQDTLTQTLSGDTIGTVLVNCSSDYDTELFRLQGDLRKAADYGDSATAAYSLRYVTDSYDSVVVRVRRSSDNAELDFVPANIGDSLVNWVNTDVVQYTSDFTSGNEDLSEVNCTGTDGESIGGVSDAYKMTSDINGNPQVFIATKHPDTGNTYNATFDVYMPSTNSTATTFSYKMPNNTDTILSPILDTWTTYEFETLGGSNLSRFVLQSASIGDELYIKNWVITELTADGHVTTWYDQMGANDATQTTASAQPKIVDAGVLVTENGKAAIRFDGVDDNLVSTSKFSLSPSGNGWYAFGVVNTDTTGLPNQILISMDNLLIGERVAQLLKISSNNFNTIAFEDPFAAVTTSSVGAIAKNNTYLLSSEFDGNSLNNYKNSVLADTDIQDNQETKVTYLVIGATRFTSPQGFLDGRLSEVGIYDTVANRSLIESEINAYYNIDTGITQLSDTRIIRNTDTLRLVTGQVDTTTIGAASTEDRIALSHDADTISVSLNGADVIKKAVNYTQDYTEWFFSTQSPVTYYELIRWGFPLLVSEMKTLTQ